MPALAIRRALQTYCPEFLTPFLERIEASDVGYRLAKGVFWSMAGAVLSRGLMLAANIFVARILGKTGYGELGMIQSTIGMFGVFAGFGLGLTATKHVAEFRRSDPERAGRVIALSRLVAIVTGGVMALGLFWFAPWVAQHSINAPHLTGVLRISALMLYLSALNGAQTGALAGFEAFKAIAYVNLITGLISFPILLFGAWFGGLTGAVWALSLNLAVNWLLNLFALRKETHHYKIPFTFKQCSQEFSILWNFSLPAVFSGALVGPITWTCNAMLVNQPGGYGEMGIFNAALTFQNLLLFIGGMLNVPLLSMVSNAGSTLSEKLSTINILSSWFIGVMVAIPLLCFPEIAQVVFGKDFNSHNFKIVFSLVVLYTAILMYKTGIARIIAAKNLLWWGFFSNAFWAIILLISTKFLVHRGATGLATSYIIAYAANTVILVPLYISRNLVPKGTLISWGSIFIWFLCINLVLMNLFDISLVFRSIIFIPCLFIVGIIFLRFAKPVVGEEAQGIHE